jgi:hypothetical protein
MTRSIIRATIDLEEESFFDPVTCSPDELREKIQYHERRGNRERAAFLLGVQHARVFVSAATNGRIF